ncbi:MAG: isopentenyl-diphosphate Delta-isomerase [Gammaproteobacteria bacterium]|nr:isopentenyl-diphosphate Delta-isomerase [Gammaproteobacteria bacterium]
MNYKEKIVSDPNDQLILVNSDDNKIGYSSKSECHKGEGKLHRAFSVFIFNSSGQLLIQKRSSNKELWDLHWSNSCCSHPRKNERTKSAAIRRLKEELGIVCKLHYIYKFIYHAQYKDAGSEHELCHVFVGLFDGEIQANQEEIDDWKFIKTDDLEKELSNSRENYTPWMRMEWRELMDDQAIGYKGKVVNLLGLGGLKL